ncbi:CTD small phosphatase-like protein isoform X3 [Antechinus flavipes]|uniref:CTD small phosphatase-like protein isoform X3 n=1 Tax=Antechinus flavipes TaxID=38775 RepID=UPI00223553E5|nr:CTD small phosphatase-like protein isoform X3 [Antechinus flavipes]
MDAPSIITQVTKEDESTQTSCSGRDKASQSSISLKKQRSRSIFSSLFCCFRNYNVDTTAIHSTNVLPPMVEENGGLQKGDQRQVIPIPSPCAKYLLPELKLSDYGKKCMVIDLDETLVHSSFKPISNADFIVPVEIDGTVHQVSTGAGRWRQRFSCGPGRGPLPLGLSLPPRPGRAWEELEPPGGAEGWRPRPLPSWGPSGLPHEPGLGEQPESRRWTFPCRAGLLRPGCSWMGLSEGGPPMVRGRYPSPLGFPACLPQCPVGGRRTSFLPTARFALRASDRRPAPREPRLPRPSGPVRPLGSSAEAP